MKSTSNFQSLFSWLLVEKTVIIKFTNLEDERSCVLFFHENLFVKSDQSDDKVLPTRTTTREVVAEKR